MANTLQFRSRLAVPGGVLVACLMLAACDGKPLTGSAGETTPDTAKAAAASSVDPHAAIVPEPTKENDAISETGPAEGGTAIGGIVNHDQQDNNGASSHASAPTGGDGAAGKTQPPSR